MTDVLTDHYLWRRRKYGYNDENGNELKNMFLNKINSFQMYCIDSIIIVKYRNGIIEILDEDGFFIMVYE